MSHQLRADQTREHLLAAASDLFTRYGYDATGVAEICEAASVSKGAFYHHFPSKQAVFLALLEQWVGELDSVLAAAAQQVEPAPQRLAAMAGLFEHAFGQAAGRLPMFLEFWRQAAKEPQVWQATIEPYRRFRDTFAGVIETGVAEDSFHPVDPEVAGQVLVALGVGLILQGSIDPDGADWGRVARESVNLLLQGLRREA
jgi:AcrR family transcriptional regulator